MNAPHVFGFFNHAGEIAGIVARLHTQDQSLRPSCARDKYICIYGKDIITLAYRTQPVFSKILPADVSKHRRALKKA